MAKNSKSIRLDLKLHQERTTIYAGEVTTHEDATFTYSVRGRTDARLWDWDVSRDDNGYGGPALRTDCVSGYAATKTLALVGIADSIKYMLGVRS